MKFYELVASTDRIHRQLDRLASRARGRRLDRLVQDGVRLSELLDERERVVGLVARALRDASYRPGVATTSIAQLGGKPRELAQVGALDLLVHAVVAEVLSESIESSLSPCLWSYRRGRSAWQALRSIARDARRHRRARPDPRTRGLYVLRADVRAYTDEIPIDDGALLWREIEAALAADAPAMEMVRALMRPAVASGGRPGVPRDRGLLFGLPTTTVSANLYLSPLDEAMSALGGTYARFGDDVLFASESPELVRTARSQLERILGERGLAVNPRKAQVLFWNGAARPSATWREAHPTTHVTFLGAAIGADGTLSLPSKKWSALLRELRARIRRTAALARHDEVAGLEPQLLVTIANEVLDVRSPLAHAYAPLVADLVSDRAQLRQLDYLIALAIAEAVGAELGPRAFRALPPRALRDLGLLSRVVLRNDTGRVASDPPGVVGARGRRGGGVESVRSGGGDDEDGSRRGRDGA